MYKIICEQCGSDEDLEFNACGYWDPHEEDYEWVSIEAYCHKCGDIVPTKKVRIKNLKKSDSQTYPDDLPDWDNGEFYKD